VCNNNNNKEYYSYLLGSFLGEIGGLVGILLGARYDLFIVK
jgi:hypothetical protein